MKITETHFESAMRAPIGSLILEDDSQIIQDENWYQILTPSVKHVSLNEVFLSHVSEREADRRVEETISNYREYGLPFKWSIGPMSNTDAIEKRIQHRAQESWHFRGMVIDSSATIPSPVDVRVERVNAENFDEFIEVFTRGWSLGVYRTSTQRRLARTLGEGTSHPYFLAKRGDVALGTAGSVIKPGYGYLTGAVVLPEFRGSGAYRALIHTRLIDFKSRGLSYAVTQARDTTSAPILEGLGFTTAFRAKIYRF